MEGMSPLRSLRQRLKMTQTALAAELGVDESTIGRWETGVRRPDLGALRPALQRLCVARGLAWNDRFLFEPAELAPAATPSADAEAGAAP